MIVPSNTCLSNPLLTATYSKRMSAIWGEGGITEALTFQLGKWKSRRRLEK
jgi:hypothetical protein